LAGLARRHTLLTLALALAGPGLAILPQARAAPGWSIQARCAPGARTLSPPGSTLYPDLGNGGYVSVHTDVYLDYDAGTNRFLPGNHVVLTDRATQCLSSFSLDLERRSANRTAGPDLTVASILVNGQPARFSFAQPAYPGDPHGPADPDPDAHLASQYDPVGGPQHDPLPPACSPELAMGGLGARDSGNGQPCPADKLVIIPPVAIPDGSVFTVGVSYSGRPGVHNDGDGSIEGWFHAPGGGFVTTEPAGAEDWLPLNDYPTAKPSYDFYDTVNAGRTAIANGVLVSVTRHRPSRDFPDGSVTWHWHTGFPVASYLAETSAGDYRLTEHTGRDGIRYYFAQDTSIGADQQRANSAVAGQQPAITALEAEFSGAYPFSSDGVITGITHDGFEEEMQTMITFAGGTIALHTLYHENMHQWWGDNVTEASYRMTFYKEGLATVGEYLQLAATAIAAAGGLSTPAGQAALTTTLTTQFGNIYAQGGSFWATAPSNPSPFGLFYSPAIYDRPAAAYIALRQILGPARFGQALRAIQRRYAGGTITEPELEAAFRQWLPSQRPACQQRLGEFFHQWFDTAYPAGGGAQRPQLTGPGLAGPRFYGGTCPSPS
jgi:hypothetical protein